MSEIIVRCQTCKNQVPLPDMVVHLKTCSKLIMQTVAPDGSRFGLYYKGSHQGLPNAVNAAAIGMHKNKSITEK